jgi:hypothetical protein
VESPSAKATGTPMARKMQAETMRTMLASMVVPPYSDAEALASKCASEANSRRIT